MADSYIYEFAFFIDERNEVLIKKLLFCKELDITKVVLFKQKNFKEDEVSVTITNSEFVEDTLEILRGDMFFKIFDKANKDFEKHKMNYHLEFQTKNDNTMIIRMFEYGFRKGKENTNEGNDNIKRLYFPK